MDNQIIAAVLLASTALLGITPIIVEQIAKDVPDKIKGLKLLLTISLWAGIFTLVLAVASYILPGLCSAGAVITFLIQAILFAFATTTLWSSKFKLK